MCRPPADGTRSVPATSRSHCRRPPKSPRFRVFRRSTQILPRFAILPYRQRSVIRLRWNDPFFPHTSAETCKGASLKQAPDCELTNAAPMKYRWGLMLLMAATLALLARRRRRRGTLRLGLSAAGGKLPSLGTGQERQWNCRSNVRTCRPGAGDGCPGARHNGRPGAVARCFPRHDAG